MIRGTILNRRSCLWGGVDRERRSGLTLVELLVVIAIIGVLVGLLLPAVQAAREAARRLQCANNMRQIGLACHNYHSVFKTLPPGRLVYRGWNSSGNPTRVVTGFLAMVLPYMEGSNLYNIYNQQWGFDDIANQPAVNVKVPSFICPSSPGGHQVPIFNGWNLGITNLTGMVTHYQGVRGIHHLQTNASGATRHVWDATAGILNMEGTSFAEITDGSSNTILLFELAGKPNHWRQGIQQEVTDAQHYAHGPWAGNNGVGIFNLSADGTLRRCHNCNFFINVDNFASPYSFHPGVLMIVLADGSTRSISENLDSEVFVNLAKKQDGMVVGEF